MSVTTKRRAKVEPVTVFTKTVEKARELAAKDRDGRALTTGVGTLMFHGLIAQHGAGEFTTLYCPIELKGAWARPIGGKVREV